MTTATPQSILSVPPETQPFDAYVILGLTAFESSRTKIKAAAEDAINRLNRVRSSTDEQVWVIAAQWVNDAHSILSDAGKKAAYDRKLTARMAAKAPAVDPLAGFLPGRIKQVANSANSSNKPVPATNLAASALPTQAPAIATPTLPPETPAPAFGLPQAPIGVGRSRSRARRGLPWLSIFLSLFCLLGIGGLGGLLFLLQRGNLPSIVITPDGVTVAQADTDGDGRAVAVPGNVTDRVNRPREIDPVMGGLAGDMPPPRQPEMLDDVDTEVVGNNPSMKPMDAPEMPMAEAALPETPAPEMTAPEMTAPEMTTPEMPAPEMSAPDIPSPPPTDEQIKAGDVAITAVITAVKQHDWARMKQLAEDSQAAAASDEQKEQAAMIYQLVDLATFYHGGIEKGLAMLKAGNELDITDDLKIVIVETGPNKLIVRYNGKNKEYAFDTIPLSLAHKIAKLAMSSDAPTTIAAKNCYQAIAAVTTQPYRDAAVAELEKITEEVEGAEPAKLVAAIRLVYQP